VDKLSQNVFTAPSSGTPNMHNLYHKLSKSSTVILMAMNSEPKVEVSTVFCAFEYQKMGALFRKMRIPACDLRVT